MHGLPAFLDLSDVHNMQIMKSSQIIAVAADYASEIENSVGSEIYGPIFKAGLFIFVSGIVSSLVVAFIVSSSNSWEALEDEFQKGKEAQFIEMMGEKHNSLNSFIFSMRNVINLFQASPLTSIITQRKQQWSWK